VLRQRRTGKPKAPCGSVRTRYLSMTKFEIVSAVGVIFGALAQRFIVE
jgi:hypothetical protein